MSVYRFQHPVARLPIVILALALVSACATSSPDVVSRDGINDPNEARNRKVHAFNIKLDKAILRPAGRGYSKAVPDEFEDSISNFATNLAQPSMMVNSLLQGDFRGAGLSTVRFLTNTVLGFGGLVDAATEFQVPQHNTDFGETLYVWGAAEGPYVELPVVGPATRRDAVGRVVDMFTNPLTYSLPSPEKYYSTGAKLASRLGDRGRYSETVDSILYESADSYSQARLIYLQNRRFELGSSGGGDAADPYSDDPYSDIYEDPYAQ